MGRLSVSESGFGIGTRWMCFARCGSSRWMRACCVIRSAVWIHSVGSLLRRLRVNPSLRAL